jgi:hypothetical protein
MLLQPADFYSYSRATGTKPPENDRERAAMATDVIDFKRNQLRAPAQSDEGRDLNLVALGAGILGSIIATAGGAAVLNRKRKAPVERIQDTDISEIQTLTKGTGIDTTKPLKKITTPTPSKKSPVVIKGDVGKIVQTGKTSSLTADDIAEMNRRSQIQPQAKATLTNAEELGVLQNLKNNLPKADFDTRFIAYVNSGEKKFLDLNYNAKTVGLNQYLEDFASADSPLIQPKFNSDGTVKSAVYKPIELGIEQGGEPVRGVGGVDRAVTIETDEPTLEIGKKVTLEDDSFVKDLSGGRSMPLSQEGTAEALTLQKQNLTVLQDESVLANKQKKKELGTQDFLQDFLEGKTTVGKVESEQSVARRTEFAEEWDKNLNVKGTGITKPRFETRAVTLDDLQTPIKQGTEDITFEQKLSIEEPEKLELIKRGQAVVMNVPFKVNKEKAARDLLKARENNDPNVVVLRKTYEEYETTGKALVPIANATIGQVAKVKVTRPGQKPTIERGSILKTDLPEDERRFEQVRNIERLPDVTPSYVQKGNLVGGVSEPLLAENLYNLKYVDSDYGKVVVNAQNNKLLQVTEINQKTDKLPIKVSVAEQENFVTMQPVGLPSKLEPVGIPVRRNSNRTSDLYRVYTTSVNAPIQILDAKTRKPKNVRLSRPLMEEATAKANLAAQKTTGKKYPFSGEIANELDAILKVEQGIELPVLQSGTKGEFVDSLLGRPKNKPQTFKYATLDKKGTVYPYSGDAEQQLIETYNLPSQTFEKDDVTGLRARYPKQDFDKSRGAADVNIKDIKEKVSDRLEAERRDIEGNIITDFDEGFADMGAREVTSPTINKRQEELNRKEAEKSKARAFLDQRVNILLGIEEDPAKIKAEIQETRQLEKRERESRKSVQAATANLYQQLKRRSGKKKGGR